MNPQRVFMAATTAAWCAVLLLAQGQSPQDQKARQAKAENIARAFELNARTVTLLDRQGKELRQVGPRAMYNAVVLSPDAKRLAVIKTDLEKENQDIFVLDLAIGASTQITAGQSREFTAGPV